MNKTTDIKINEILSVYDGDTFRGKVNAFPNWLGDNIGFRINGIDCPEKGWRAKCEYERNLSEEATQFLTDWLNNATEIRFDIIKFDKYGGRLITDVRIDGVDVGQTMIEKGYAISYSGKTKKSWCDGKINT